MIESINKNTEVVGVSDALKQLATKKSSPNNMSYNAVNPPLLKQSPIDDGTIMDNKITINPSSSIDDVSVGPRSDCENVKGVSEMEDATQTCGWWNFRPKTLRRFMNPRYALAFLCLAGAIQGN
ncbi:CLUMA_CG013738, isoform A [Clunio marinus]|uniref:CLUMA_CG013738, isoform A n=1 Tax=Clunio marinus TaxID=568069 RepID=A0A1J1ILN5_9DIPT|nr:CLUMA_CG013738, isoform A [Clunio marinus]